MTKKYKKSHPKSTRPYNGVSILEAINSATNRDLNEGCWPSQEEILDAPEPFRTIHSAIPDSNEDIIFSEYINSEKWEIPHQSEQTPPATPTVTPPDQFNAYQSQPLPNNPADSPLLYCPDDMGTGVHYWVPYNALNSPQPTFLVFQQNASPVVQNSPIPNAAVPHVFQGESPAESSSSSLSTPSTGRAVDQNNPTKMTRRPFHIEDRIQTLCLKDLHKGKFPRGHCTYMGAINNVARNSIYDPSKQKKKLLGLAIEHRGGVRIPKGMVLGTAGEVILQEGIGGRKVEEKLSIIYPGQDILFPQSKHKQYVTYFFDFTEKMGKAIIKAEKEGITIDRPLGDSFLYNTIAWSLEEYSALDLYFCVVIDEIWVELKLHGVIDKRRAFCLHFCNKNGSHHFTTLALGECQNVF
ncbi:hypothetical protein BGX27_011565 [Mortierella sp. AM989]|nr:hypothetical protein BGX27_011565 [Mortierella sp. AM989]